MKPRIFISTVSSELGKIRQLTANVLQGLGYDPVWQDIFGTEPGDLTQVLRDKIDDCQGLIQIVGRAFGQEPSDPDPDFGRVSYTQFEFLYARKRGKKTWLLFAEDGCTQDRPLEALDLPLDPNYPDPAAYQAERRALQEVWRQRLLGDGHLRHQASSDFELELKLQRLNREFAELRRGFRRWQRIVVLVGLAGLVLGACTIAALWKIGAQVEQVSKLQTITLDRVQGHLRDASEQALERDLAAADSAPLFDDREKQREAGRKAHERRMSRVTDLAADFVALGKKEDTSPILREMLRILNTREETHSVEKAIGFLEGQLEAILTRVDTRRQAEQEQNRRQLQPVLEAARLAEANGQSAKARQYYEACVQREPDWPSALEYDARFLFDQANQSRYHGSLRSAVADAERSFEMAQRLNAHNAIRPGAQRLLASASNAMGDVLTTRGQPGDTEQALTNYKRSRELSESLLERDLNSAQAARDVSVSLNKLGDFLAERGQRGDAELALEHYARSRELSESLLKRNPDSAEAARDVSISLNKLGKFLAERGQTGDAEQALEHYARSVELSESLLKRNPDSAQAARDVSISLNRLGDFLAQRGQRGDAEQALEHYARSRKLSESALKRHPDSAEAARDVSLSLDRLGDVLTKRGQPGDVEQVLRYYTRSLELRESLLKRNPDSGEAARDVSLSLDRLGDVLTKRGQPGDVEQVLKHYTRSLELRESLLKRNPDSGEAARDVSVSLNKLGDSVAKRGQPDDAEHALKHYARSLALSESLLKRNPDSARAARDVMVSHYKLAEHKLKTMEIEPAITHFTQGIQVLDAMIARGMNAVQAQRDRAILLARVRYCRDLRLASGDWDALLSSAPERLPALLSLRVTAMARRGRLAAVAEAGAKLRELKPKTADNLYNAACAYALCAGLVIHRQKEPAQTEAAQRQKYVDLALACLKEAISAGFSDFKQMRNDADLAALHGNSEFERLFPR